MFNGYSPANDVEYESNECSNYCLFVPRFPLFTFYFGQSSDINISEDGSQSNPTGSPFDFNMMADFNFFGKVDNYRFNINVWNDPENKYENCLIIVDVNGNLLNENDLTSKSINVYNDAKEEIISIINTCNDLFNI